MGNQSKLLDSAEKVCLLFKDVVLNADGDQISAATSLVKMAVAVNELSVEVQKGKELLVQFKQLKKELMPESTDNTQVSEEKPNAQAQTVQPQVDPNKIVEDIMKSLNIPADLLPKKDSSGQ